MAVGTDFNKDLGDGSCGQAISHGAFDNVDNDSLKITSYGEKQTVYCGEAIPNSVKLLQKA